MDNTCSTIAVLALGAVTLVSLKYLVEKDQSTPVTAIPTNQVQQIPRDNQGIALWTSTLNGVNQLRDLAIPGARFTVQRALGEFNLPVWHVKAENANLPPFVLSRLPPFLRGNATTSVVTI